ncbi:hypothetical protein ANCDUO_15183 [Ancylostoma duodenale]|uniref:Mos1 transposase HTH domain-containing protein n=1 Tax=Ancylostoma duodenale TaxID=51022 RepID=A0A0C2G147_9BILA|nr:hypothetical protein ANCDUO_15183 [Ancylostoma duodenale]
MTHLKSSIRCCLLYDFKRGKTASESHRDLCDAFGQDVISERQCERWFHKFRSGNESLEDDVRGRPPSVADMVQLKEAIEEDAWGCGWGFGEQVRVQLPNNYEVPTCEWKVEQERSIDIPSIDIPT